MALIFMDGFDHYGAVDELINKWDSVSSTIDYLSTSGRFGGGAIRIDLDDNSLLKNIPATDTVMLQFAFKVEPAFSWGSDLFILFKSGGNTIFALKTELTTGRLIANRGISTIVETSTLNLEKDMWHYIEIKLVISDTGSFLVRVDGVDFINFSGDTLESSFTTCDTVQFYSPSTGQDSFYDDIIIMDDTGSKLNDLIGDTRIETLYPDGDGNQTDFTPTGAGSTNADRVDEGDAGPDDDTTYVESDVVSDIDLYTMTNLTTIQIDTVHAVQSVSYAKKDDAGARTSRSLVRTGTTTDNGPSQALTTDYKYFVNILEDDPDTATDWTESGVNGVEVGHEVLT